MIEERIFKYGAFDFDDNLRKMDTEIYLRRLSDNSLVSVSTEQFRLVKNNLKENGFYIKSYDESMINFRKERDCIFEENFRNSKVAISWPDFVECLNYALIFGIITARGNSREAFKKMFFEFIMNNVDGIDRKMLIDHQKEYMSALSIDYSGKNDDYIVNYYLDLYKHYGMEDGLSSMEILGKEECHDPGEFKPAALIHFKNYIKEQSEKVIKALKVVNPKVSIGFSDDDSKTVDLIVRFLENREDVHIGISVYDTSITKVRR